MSVFVYLHITSHYLPLVLPQGFLESPDPEQFQIISTLLAPSPYTIHSPIATEVVKFLHTNHKFDFHPYPDALPVFTIIVDINPENQAGQSFFNFCNNVQTGTPQYYMHWDVFPCVIPNYIYKAIFTWCKLNELPEQQVVKHFENWWGYLLCHQNALLYHLHEPQPIPYLLPTLLLNLPPTPNLPPDPTSFTPSLSDPLLSPKQ